MVVVSIGGSSSELLKSRKTLCLPSAQSSYFAHAK